MVNKLKLQKNPQKTTRKYHYDYPQINLLLNQLIIKNIDMFIHLLSNSFKCLIINKLLYFFHSKHLLKKQ